LPFAIIPIMQNSKRCGDESSIFPEKGLGDLLDPSPVVGFSVKIIAKVFYWWQQKPAMRGGNTLN
jgi:hypothetical protein